MVASRSIRCVKLVSSGPPAIRRTVTGWGNWRQTSRGASLTTGFNRLRLAKGAWYAETDYLELA